MFSGTFPAGPTTFFHPFVSQLEPEGLAAAMMRVMFYLLEHCSRNISAMFRSLKPNWYREAGNPELEDLMSSANANWDGKFNHVGKVKNPESALLSAAPRRWSIFAPFGNSF